MLLLALSVHIGLIGQGWGLWGTSPPRYQSKCSPIVQINNTQKVGTGGGGTIYIYIYIHAHHTAVEYAKAILTLDPSPYLILNPRTLNPKPQSPQHPKKSQTLNPPLNAKLGDEGFDHLRVRGLLRRSAATFSGFVA